MDVHGTPIGMIESLVLNLAILFVMAGLLLKISAKKDLSNNINLAFVILVATVGRILLSGIPNVQPVSALVLLTGIYMGYTRAMFAGVSIALLSNIYLGNGLWTIYQAAGWAMIGIMGAALSKYLQPNNKLHHGRLMTLGALSGLMFNWVVSLSILHYIEISALPLFLLNGIPYDFLHMVGNVFFLAWTANHVEQLMKQKYELRRATYEIQSQGQHN